jgi:hypothetical protein
VSVQVSRGPHSRNLSEIESCVGVTGVDRPIVRTIDGFVATLKAMVAKTAQASAYQAAMAGATDALDTETK